MKTKLTLSVDKSLVQYARKQARINRKSVSGMFSEYLMYHKRQASKKAVPTIKNMAGSLKQYPIDDSKKTIRSAYAKKHFS
jgi:hypothetical protein